MKLNQSKEALLNEAARALIANHVSKPVAEGWPYAARVGIETICQTFSTDPAASEAVLLSLLQPERLSHFPHNDLSDLAHNFGRLPPQGETVVVRLFEAAFAAEPPPGTWGNFGGRILPMRIQSSDEWNQIHYLLAEYYTSRKGDQAATLTEAACIAWNATVQRRERRNEITKSAKFPVLSVFNFRSKSVSLIQDYSHIWERNFEPEENRILSHFESLLDGWAASSNRARLRQVVNRFLDRNQTSLMWNVFMEVGARHPHTLGVLLAEALDESVFLTNPDYRHAATLLLKALHKTSGTKRRLQLENYVLDLPNKIRLPRGTRRKALTEFVERAQNRALAAFDEQNISSKQALSLFRKRRSEQALVFDIATPGPRITEHILSEEEIAQRRGIDLKAVANKQMLLLREALKPFLPDSPTAFDQRQVERHWSVIAKCERAVRKYKQSHPQMAEELWGYLAGACAKTAHYAKWPTTSARWSTFRRILLKAAVDRNPTASKQPDASESCSAWGWPAPRIDAAQGLTLIAARLGRSDKSISKALRALSRDEVATVRFNLMTVLPRLYRPAPRLMWEIVDIVVAREKNFAVLDALLHSLDWLWKTAPEKVLGYVTAIARKAQGNASDENHIHETLAGINLFEYLGNGRPECEAYIKKLVADCSHELENKALLAQLHGCRTGGWMTVGDPLRPDSNRETRRQRTWHFLTTLLDAAQSKLKRQRDRWRQLFEAGKAETKSGNAVRAEMDRAAHLVDGICTQLFFASGAFADKSGKENERLNPEETVRFWNEAKPLFERLANEPHPHTAYELVQTLCHLLPCDPEAAFLLCSQSIQSSSAAGFQNESLAVGAVVKMIECALADHREIFHATHENESKCLSALLDVLDLFVEAGWPEARRLTHRLEEIYR